MDQGFPGSRVRGDGPADDHDARQEREDVAEQDARAVPRLPPRDGREGGFTRGQTSGARPPCGRGRGPRCWSSSREPDLLTHCVSPGWAGVGVWQACEAPEVPHQAKQLSAQASAG
ncbi:hypothetical protein GCM10023148_18920 [Actinokineospora soli]